jgi:hypothetical protein
MTRALAPAEIAFLKHHFSQSVAVHNEDLSEPEREIARALFGLVDPIFIRLGAYASAPRVGQRAGMWWVLTIWGHIEIERLTKGTQQDR